MIVIILKILIILFADNAEMNIFARQSVLTKNVLLKHKEARSGIPPLPPPP